MTHTVKSMFDHVISYYDNRIRTMKGHMTMGWQDPNGNQCAIASLFNQDNIQNFFYPEAANRELTTKETQRFAEIVQAFNDNKLLVSDSMQKSDWYSCKKLGYVGTITFKELAAFREHLQAEFPELVKEEELA